MVLIVKNFIEYLREWDWSEKTSPRMKHLLFMDTPWPPVGICIAYLIFVLKVGPAFMKNREPGRKKILNLSTPQCVRHGVIVHELLHALGFYHQQSATERDEYVRINWQNILDGHSHNFNKYARTYITNFGVEYDYLSIMHYSSRAFSKNGKATIEPLDPRASLGQRRGMSAKDISKLNEMYDPECSRLSKKPLDLLDSYLDELFDLIDF